ncbi:MAG: hypothetical protein HRT38_18345, partial [Alteromonadaceae bacterium]|nr:hypothetical protein [Alteromonadaceae bacterium]
MVNNNQKFRKSKIALAVVLTMGLSACGVDGDEGSVSNSQSQTQTDATQNSVGNQELTGTVTGAVFDTNGNPIAGAAVYLGKQETVTGAGGIYVFNKVPVVNVVGVNSETVYDADTAIADYDLTGKMAVTIVVDGYLGGTVFVSPQAQVNNTGEDSDTTVQTFVDGFTAEAGTAVLPALTAKVYGYLTDCSTDTDLDGTGEEPAVGVTVAFDVTRLSETGTNGSDFILAVNSFFSVATNENGMFEAMLPADTSGGMLLEGWYLTTVEATNSALANFNTEHEAVSNYVGTFEVCKVAPNGGEGTIANAAPMFSSIDGTVGTVEASFKDEQDQGAAAGVAEVVAVAAVAATTGTPAIPAIPGTPAIPAVLASMATYALLADGIVNDIVIHFSEALPNMTADDFRV